MLPSEGVRIYHVAAVAVASALAACGGGSNGGSSSPTSPGASGGGLTGTWRATRAEYVSATNSNLRVDVVAQGGGGTTVSLALTSNTFTQTMTDPGQSPE